MDLELKRPEKLRVKLDGETYELKRLTVKEVFAIEGKFKEESNGNFLVGFLTDRGMPEDVVLGLEVELLEEIVENLKPKKKA